MSNIAQYVDGQLITTNASTLSLSSASAASSTSNVDKDDFLQLLVAQMKYQDPLEPTDNTEWVSQYAQFSELESMQAVSNSMDLMRASSLVGQTVVLNAVDANGKENTISGKVDYVVYENNKAYLSVNESLYSIDSLQTVADTNYLAAYAKAEDLVSRVAKLGNPTSIKLSDEEEITAVKEVYENMTDYERTFVAEDIRTLIEQHSEQLRILKQTEV